VISRFACYRAHPPDSYREQGAANPPDEPQFEGAVFTDGTCVVRWLTACRSHSVWGSLADLLAVHGHEEYGTWFEWPDGKPEGAP
jgi:hypothetical protein